MMNVANYHINLREKRIGVMLHYDASASDKGAVEWLTKDPRCHVSYHWLVLDDGKVVEIAPRGVRAWHAGVCRSSNPTHLPYTDANSAFLGIAIAATDGDTATSEQIESVVRLTREEFQRMGWDASETWRIVGHSSEAWPRGRKHDPEGSHEVPVLSVEDVRRACVAP